MHYSYGSVSVGVVLIDVVFPQTVRSNNMIAASKAMDDTWPAMIRALLTLLLSILSPLSAMAEAKPFQKIERCKMKADRWNDGDSFHVVTGDAQREIVARLYFVDTPEAETAFRDRVDEQAAYWGITAEQAKDIAHEATAFTA